MEEFERYTNRKLHEEHVAVIDLMARLEQMLSRPAMAAPDDEALALLRKVEVALHDEVERHFDFEEQDLFPILEEWGDGDLVSLLSEEHVSVREAATALQPLLVVARTGSLDADQWQQVRRHGLELAERLASHAQKEEISMLPSLENALSAEQDGELWERYMAA